MKGVDFGEKMTREILEGRKTVFRQLVSPYPNDSKFSVQSLEPPYEQGDILYAKESWRPYRDTANGCLIEYKFGWHELKDKIYSIPGRVKPWLPADKIPLDIARIFFRVIGIRIERLQDITEEQARKEGVRIGLGGWPYFNCKDAFGGIWNSSIEPAKREKYGWAANPWVWVIEFERISKEEATKTG